MRDFPDQPRMRVCAETIYQALYIHARSELTRTLPRPLRRGRSVRKRHKRADVRRPRFIDPMNSIHQRPACVDDRTMPGHWEGDLIVGTGQRSAIATLVERTTRYVMLAHLGRERSAEAVRDALIAAFADVPAPFRATLTWDQGAEMSEHRAFAKATGIEVYFADPGSPWQRGSNENTNGLLRQYFPKGTDLARHSTDVLQAVANELNNRPRESLDWDTPAERVHVLMNTT